MARYRKKATECELLQFKGLGDPIPAYVNLRMRDSRIEVWNELHTSWIALESGDYLNISTPGDVYPIKARIVDESYEEIAVDSPAAVR